MNNTTRSGTYVRTGAYERISPKPDENREVLAIARQRELCHELCERLGWTVTAIYTDESVSATSKKPRPGYQALLADMADGKLDAVVAWDLDRLHRKVTELENFIDVANLRNILLATCQGDLDISTPDGRAMARMKAVFSRLEIEQKTLRQLAASRQKANSGAYWGSRRPFGFQLEEGVLTPHPVEGPMVALLYRSILEGVSQRSLATLLNTEGLLSTEGKPWRQSSLRQVLIAPRNAGLRVYQKKVIGKALWAPLVDEDTWRAVVSMVTSHPEAGKPGGKGRHLLTGATNCGLCGARMCVGVVGSARIYQCPVCRRVGRNADKMEAHVVEYVLARLSLPDARQALVHDTTKKDYLAHQDKIALLNLRLKQLAAEFATGDLTMEEWRAARDNLKAALAIEQHQVSDGRRVALLGPVLQDPRGYWSAPEVTDERRRAVITELVQVKVMPTGRGNRYNPDDVQITFTEAG